MMNTVYADNIMKQGKLIAIGGNWQYWLHNNTLYSVASWDQHYNVWCSLDKLRMHCKRLESIIGHKFFRNDENMLVLDAEFVAKYC